MQDAVARELAALEAAGRTTKEILLAKLEEEWTSEWTAEWDRALLEEKERVAARAAQLREEVELKKRNEKQRLQAGEIAAAFAAIGNGEESSGTTLPHKWIVDQDMSRKLLNVLVSTQREYLTAPAGPTELTPANEPNSPAYTQTETSENLVASSDATVAKIGTDAAVRASLMGFEVDVGNDKQSQDAAVTGTMLSRPSLGRRASMFDYADAVLGQLWKRL